MAEIERTLVVLKPDTVQRGLVGEIITRFERAGLKIVAMKMVSPNVEHYHKHYEGIGTMITRRGQEIFDIVLDQMMDSPVVAFVLEGIEAVSFVRKIAGATNPKDALPGTIRCDYTHISQGYVIPIGASLPNILHASADIDEAKQEIELWFSPSEICDCYDTAYGPIVRGKIPKKK